MGIIPKQVASSKSFKQKLNKEMEMWLKFISFKLISYIKILYKT